MSLRLITSRQNDLFRFLKTLTKPHARKKQKAFLIEGATFVAEALEDEVWTILEVLLTPAFAETERGKSIIAKAHQRQIPVTLMASALLDEIAASETPQGVLAVIRQPQEEQLEQLKVPNVARVVVLESLQDPSNVGAIIRVTDAVDALAVLYTKGTADPYAPKSVRASAGSLLHVPILPVSSIGEAVKWLKSKGFQVVGTAPKDGTNIFEADFSNKVALIVGNEAKGLSEEAKQSSDLIVTIPMLGKSASLNVAVATGIALYQILRCQDIKAKP
ncbi:MAG: RNA methyltransferase [Armatimonadetes bacterium]|nr:RNA methyltransferase [Armatimonadota bacterium]